MEIKQEIAQVQKRPETFADIRKETEARFRELVDAWMQRRSTFQTTLGAMQAFNNVFDRLEAALKRERGNVAALREALKLCVEQTCKRCRDDAAMHGNHAPCLNGCETMNRAKAALAAPPRNCDRFVSAEQAWDAYDEWVESYRSKGKTEPFNEFGWLFAPATEQEGCAK